VKPKGQLESVNLHSVNLHAVKLDFDGVDPDIAMNLLSIFWNRQHSGGSVVYRPAFMRDMACGGPYFSKLLLNAMLWIGSKYSPRNDCEAAIGSQEDLNGRVYRRRAEEIIKTSDLGFLFRSDITTIQALLILSDGLFGWCDEKSLSWHYLGIAINMIVDLGLHVGGGHRVSSKSRSAEDIEIHRRVFWSAFGT
jgi:hypothetical protein